ncbi:unnamed protein product [Cuscuta epithymum]|uniref:Uncharacterized protein n=1 Tax=Cuscuta epithymum TaxID=186058 RepID=A0AAV0GGP3_9ASTE|nr:unnamed protein product [Cuscuta epithymum]
MYEIRSPNMPFSHFGLLIPHHSKWSNGLIWPVPKPPPGCQGDRELLYSDALDVSLSSESFSSDNTADSNNNNNNNNSYKTRRNMFSRADDLEPGDLIFLRFLKDAKALAKDPLVNGGQPESSFARALDGRQLYCESLTSCTGKACGGWDILLPWRVKPEAPDSGRLRNSVGVVASSRVVDASLGHYC